MSFQPSLLQFIIVCPLCFISGFMDAVAGGGGLISLPAYLLAGLPPKLAAGTNKLSASIGTVAAAGKFLRSGHILMRLALPAALLAFPGSWLGTMLLNSLPDRQILRMLALVLPLAAAVVLLRRGSLAPAASLSANKLAPVCALSGFMIGFYDGLIGPGTGTFLILMFTWVAGADPVDASGSAKAVNLASNAASLFTQIASGNVLYALGLPAAVFAAAGGALGARAAIKGGAKLIRAVILAVLTMLFIYLAWQAFF